jgi:hypothetical protein
MELTRRDFLKVAGIGASAIALKGCVPLPTPQQLARDFVYGLEEWVGNNLYTAGLRPTDIEISETNLPIIRIATGGMPISNGYNQPESSAWMSAQDSYGGLISESTLANVAWDVEVPISIERRGNSSRILTQKSYDIETKNPENPEEDMSIRLLGMPKEEDYVLKAELGDVTLLRNNFGFSLFNGMHEDNYAPRTRYCELIMDDGNGNDSNDPQDGYLGIINLMEKPKRDDDRIDVPRLEEIDGEVSGGFVVQHMSKTQAFLAEPAKIFTTASGELYSFRSPNSGNVSENERAYIIGRLNDLEDSLYGEDFADPEKGYRNFMNVRNVIDYMILEEVVKDVDSFESSMFMGLDEDGKLTLTPWDYDGGFGNLPYELINQITSTPIIGPPIEAIMSELIESDLSPEGWHYEEKFMADRLMQDPWFRERFKERWQQHSAGILNQNNVEAWMDGEVDKLKSHGALERHYAKWNNVIYNPLYMNGFRAMSYDDEVGRLKGFVGERCNWIDEHLHEL